MRVRGNHERDVLSVIITTGTFKHYYVKWNMSGEVQEWLNWHAWNACVGSNSPRVRIPVSPPEKRVHMTEWTLFLDVAFLYK